MLVLHSIREVVLCRSAVGSVEGHRLGGMSPIRFGGAVLGT